MVPNYLPCWMLTKSLKGRKKKIIIYGLESVAIYFLVMDQQWHLSAFIGILGPFQRSDPKVMGTIEIGSLIPLIWHLGTKNWKYGLASVAVYFLVTDKKWPFLAFLGIFGHFSESQIRLSNIGHLYYWTPKTILPAFNINMTSWFLLRMGS